MDDEPIIGIDLGNSFYCFGIFDDKRYENVQIIPNDMGASINTAQFYIYKDEIRERREPFKNYDKNSDQQIIFPKMLIGRTYFDPEIQKLIKKSLLINIIKDENSDKPQYYVTDNNYKKKYYADEIYTHIFKKIKQYSGHFIGKQVEKAVITVPVYFNNKQREATKIAAENAGLEVIRIINEPTAAVIAYELNKDFVEKTILIFNLDNDIPDITIMKVYNNKFTILFSQKNENLNGNKIIDLLADFILEKFKKENNLYDIDFYNEKNKKVIRRLKEKCENRKYDFSDFRDVCISIDTLYMGMDLDFTISSVEFNRICYKMFQKYINFIQQSLNQVNLQKKDINNIIIYGELFYIFELRKMISEYFCDMKL